MSKNPHAVALGKKRSDRKTIAARANAKKGGRPRLPIPAGWYLLRTGIIVKKDDRCAAIASSKLLNWYLSAFPGHKIGGAYANSKYYIRAKTS